jgi:dTDP-4-amino-4,6-dideoxygalactose transaminase
MRIVGVGPGDRVLTSPNTFLASANCAAYVGATPDFVDVHPISHNMDADALRHAWKKDVKAVVPVAYAGQSADMPRIAEYARSQGAFVIEDASHGTGGGFVHEGKRWKLGAHPWADMTVFSFHPVKTLTTGEGGMLVTDNDEFARLARLLRGHGVERDRTRFQGFGSDTGALAERGPWVYEMQELGYNFRITDLQCALGRSQLAKLDHFIERRRAIVAAYNTAFAGLDWLSVPGVLREADRGHVSWHLYTVEIDFERIGRTRTEVMQVLREQGVGSQVLYIPVHLQPWYRQTYGYAPGKCPVAEQFYARCLSLPLFPTLTDTDVARVARTVGALG